MIKLSYKKGCVLWIENVYITWWENVWSKSSGNLGEQEIDYNNYMYGSVR